MFSKKIFNALNFKETARECQNVFPCFKLPAFHPENILLWTGGMKTPRTNTDEYAALSKAELTDLLRLYARFALTLDGLWFLGVEDLHDTAKAIELDEQVWRRYGRAEGRLLKRFLRLETVSTLGDICRIYLLTPIFGNLGAEAEIRDGRCRLSVTDCHPQKARIRKGLGEFACKGVGLDYFEGMFAELNPDIRFRCLVCPPDEHTEDLWCAWEAWIEGRG